VVTPKSPGRFSKSTEYMRGLMAGGEVPISHNIPSGGGVFWRKSGPFCQIADKISGVQ
jgi:hypothetical protein